MALVFLNGAFVAQDEAKISVLDRGFLLGDGVYEVIPCYNSRLFRLAAHLDRFKRSMAAIRIENPYTDGQWQTNLDRLIEKNGGGNFSVYVQVTRGVAARDHAFPKGVMPTVYAMASRFAPAERHTLEQGTEVITLNDERWAHCDIKAISLLANVLARQQAIEKNMSEAIFVRDNFVTEGAASNIFIVKNGVLKTAPKGPSILGGITRDLILEIAQAHGLPCEEKPFTRDALYQADEAWLTSSIREVVPILRVDDRVIGGGCAGPVWQQMIEWFSAFKRSA